MLSFVSWVTRSDLINFQTMYVKDSLKNIINRCCYYTNKGVRNWAIYLLSVLSMTITFLGAAILVILLTVTATNLKTASLSNATKIILNIMAGTTSPAKSTSEQKTSSYRNRRSDKSNVNRTEDFSFYPSPYDGRDYKYTTLPNGLRVLAISNPWCFKSGASLTVSVGSFNDPSDFPGLAHLCEHMTFYGKKKTSESMQLAKYVSTHDGDYNALTKEEQTTFTFFIQTKFFGHSLSYFAEMLANPAFDPLCLQNEILAVDQEYQQNFCSDEWTVWELLKLVTNSNSSFHKFHHGNMKSLNRSGVLTELKKFYSQYYTANQVSATLWLSCGIELEKILPPQGIKPLFHMRLCMYYHYSLFVFF